MVDYYTTHAPFSKSSGVSIAAVGTVSIALQYCEVISPPTHAQMRATKCTMQVLSFCLIFDRYPEYLKIGMWSGLALSSISIFCCSFATEVRPAIWLHICPPNLHCTQVWQLILLQGVGFGVGGGLLYVPVIKLLSEWFSERRGLAGGIIFAGGGVGGKHSQSR